MFEFFGGDLSLRCLFEACNLLKRLCCILFSIHTVPECCIALQLLWCTFDRISNDSAPVFLKRLTRIHETSRYWLFYFPICRRKGRRLLSCSVVVLRCNRLEIPLFGRSLTVYRTVYSSLFFNRILPLSSCLQVTLPRLLPHFC